MKAKAINSIYSAIAVKSDGTTYPLPEVTTSLSLTEGKNELAQKVSISLMNIKVEGTKLSKILVAGVRLFVYANDGSKKDEVFRGVIWEDGFISDASKDINLIAYDHLIYPQKSKDCKYFSAGKSTKSIAKGICDDWGLSLQYNYESITHPKTPLNNMGIADMFIEVFDAVKDKTGAKYVIRSIKDVMHVNAFGSNSTIYKFEQGKGVISVSGSTTYEGMITKVKIVGKEDDNERVPVEATIKGSNCDECGTIQDIITRTEGTTLADAKKEANELLKEKGKPVETYKTTLPDIPWVHKGDLIQLDTEDLAGYFYVLSVTHDAGNKTMDLEVEPK